MVASRKVPVGYKATHYEYQRYVRPVKDCSEVTMKNGVCYNCGWGEDSYVPTAEDIHVMATATSVSKPEPIVEIPAPHVRPVGALALAYLARATNPHMAQTVDAAIDADADLRALIEHASAMTARCEQADAKAAEHYQIAAHEMHRADSAEADAERLAEALAMWAALEESDAHDADTRWKDCRKMRTAALAAHRAGGGK